MYDLDKETLVISDDYAFYTLEGEGKYVGMPSVFLRLASCNLTCKGFASADSPYGCDSYISWSIKNKMTFNQIFELFENNNFIEHLNRGAILKVTGGEPLLQWKQLLRFFESFVEKYEFTPRIDFETNGTIKPNNAFVDLFNATFTVSPKLTSNGDAESKTYKPEALRWHSDNKDSTFKFVINKSEDIDEIWRKYVVDTEGINMPVDRIWFMPCAGSRQEHIERAPAVAEYAKAMHVNFSPRLHLLVWDKALKV